MIIQHGTREISLLLAPNESIYVDKDLVPLGTLGACPIRISQVDNTLRILIYASGQPLVAQIFEFSKSLEIVVSRDGIEGPPVALMKELS